MRDASGKILPGAVLNPSGRPKIWREFQEAMRERTPQAVEVIDKSLSSKDDATRQWAAEKVLAYAWGRPPQRVQISGDEDGGPLKVEHGISPEQLKSLSADQLRVLLAIGATLRMREDEGGPGGD